MHKNLFIALSASSLLLLSSCSGKLGALSASNFTAEPNPLETQAGKVPVTIYGSFPEKYMKKKAVVTVVPELHFGNGQIAQAAGQTFQGEKVKGNDQTIFYRLGGRYTLKTNFTYVPDMQKSDLYVSFNAKVGKKLVEVPSVKIGTGVIATSELYKQAMFSQGGVIAQDSFQRVVAQKQEASVKFLINEAKLRKSELKNNSVKEFVNMLRKINSDKERLSMKNVEVQAYASPEGGFSFNDKLANKRQDVSSDYVKKQLKSADVNTSIDAHYTAQDWEGFKQLVQASDIQDKDVILRVLSMYKDPQEREQQIRNMSEGFQELTTGILPELRRSRLIINYEVVGRSDDQIKAQYSADATKLSADELLYAATLESDVNKKEQIYKTAAEYYDKDYRAYNNIACMELAKGNEQEAQRYLDKAIKANPNAAEAIANRGLIALKNGNLSEAEQYIAKAASLSSAEQVNFAVGNLDIAKGNYAKAAQELAKFNTNSTGLAQILNKDYSTAAATLNNVEQKDGLNCYLHAIAMARQGNKYAANSHLKEALQKDPSLKTYADNDLEFTNVR